MATVCQPVRLKMELWHSSGVRQTVGGVPVVFAWLQPPRYYLPALQDPLAMFHASYKQDDS